MVKKLIIIISLILLITIIAVFKTNSDYIFPKWSHKISLSSTIEYIQEINNILIITTKDKKYSYIDILQKNNGNRIAQIKLNHINNKPTINDHYLITESKDKNNNSYGEFYVIDLQSGDLILKEQFTSKQWSFIADGYNIFFVDIAGTLKTIDIKTKKIIWKILSENNFINSTRPSVSDERFFICNNNQILALNIKTSEILYNFKTDSKINTCLFNDNTAIVATNNDYIYAIDLILSRIKWKYKFVSLYSKAFYEIINDNYLLLLNTTNYSSIKSSVRGKLLTKKSEILHILNLNNGETIWQKRFKNVKSKMPLKELITFQSLIIESINGKLTSYFLENGLRRWEFFTKNNIPIHSYTIYDDKIFIIVDYTNKCYVYILNANDGQLINKIEIPQKNNIRFNPVVDDKNIYIVYEDNTIKAFNLPALDKDK
ncbi:MAG: hypothetical protein AB7V50_08205 [Vampirovibrionia bacterium]